MPNDNNTPTPKIQTTPEKYNSKTNNTLNQTPPQVYQLLDEVTALKKENEELKKQLENAIVLPEPKIPLPDEAPILWKDWKLLNPQKDILEFLDEVWGDWLETESIFQDQLSKLDFKALQRLRNFCKRKDISISVSDIVPAKFARTKIEKQWLIENRKKVTRILTLYSLVNKKD